MVLVLAVAAMVAALVAGPVAAEAEGERVEIGPAPFVLTVDNACNNAEIVLVTGELRGFFQKVESASGETSFKFHLEMHGMGVGSEGNRYVFDKIDDSEYKEGPPITHTSSTLLISQSSDDDLALIFVMRIGPDGDADLQVADAQCRG